MLERAIQFATQAHKGQFRKYTGEPYITHPLAVMEIVKGVPGHTPEMLVAAVLHDVVEDTDVSLMEIQEEFGDAVSDLVLHLTDISTPPEPAEHEELDLKGPKPGSVQRLLNGQHRRPHQ